MTTDESKAVTAVANTTGKAIDAGADLAKWFGKVLGTMPKDLIGLVAGDYLHEVRIRNMDRLKTRTEEIISRRRSKTVPVSASLAIPLFRAAQDESRDELQELWARLLANAMTAEHADAVRRDFFECLKALEPLDVQVLSRAFEATSARQAIYHDGWPKELGVRKDQVLVSFEHLHKLGCVDRFGYPTPDVRNDVREQAWLTPFGRELMQACSL